MCPARAAVLWHVLVANVGEEVCAVDVVPDPGLRDLVDGDQGVLDHGLEVSGEWLTAFGVGESGVGVAEDGCCCEVFH